MGSFKPVKDRDDIQVSDRWQDSAKFNSKDQIRNYKGRQYRLLSKKERDFSVVERIFRGTLGTFAVIGTLGLAFLNKDFTKAITKLFTKEKKTVRFGEALEKNTKELELGLRGANLITTQQIIHQLVKDYEEVLKHTKINNKPIDTTVPGFALHRGSEHPELKPTDLDAVIPKELQTFFGESYPDNAELLGCLLQQGMGAELIVHAQRRFDNSIVFKNPKGEVVPDIDPSFVMFRKNENTTYPDYEFSKIGDDLYVTVKMKGYFLDVRNPLDKIQSENYTISQRINLTNKKEEITTTFTKHLPVKSKQDLLQDLAGDTLQTEQEKIRRLQIDYSALKNHIILDNKVVDMGNPPFAENRGTGITPPDTLEEMFPEEIKAYFGDNFTSMAPTLALLFQQGIANELLVAGAGMIDYPKDSQSFAIDGYPYFEFSETKNGISLIIKAQGYLMDVSNGERKENYSLEMSLNLTKPDRVEMYLVKD